MIRVFIQNEAGSDQKHRHNEKTLEYKHTVTVSRPYPFPYGFVLDTTSPDGDNLDCYVLTRRPLRTGSVVECEVVGLLEQFEDGKEDHNVLANLPNDPFPFDDQVGITFQEFITHVFDHIPGKRISLGRFLPKEAAEVHIRARQDIRELGDRP